VIAAGLVAASATLGTIEVWDAIARGVGYVVVAVIFSAPVVWAIGLLAKRFRPEARFHRRWLAAAALTWIGMVAVAVAGGNPQAWVIFGPLMLVTGVIVWALPTDPGAPAMLNPSRWRLDRLSIAPARDTPRTFEARLQSVLVASWGLGAMIVLVFVHLDQPATWVVWLTTGMYILWAASPAWETGTTADRWLATFGVVLAGVGFMFSAWRVLTGG
jgi:hypothetical protein